MMFEYMEYGDLAALLQANDPCSGVTPKVKLAEVRTGSFVRRNVTADARVPLAAESLSNRDAISQCDVKRLSWWRVGDAFIGPSIERFTGCRSLTDRNAAKHKGSIRWRLSGC
jgi:hypothetical protein